MSKRVIRMAALLMTAMLVVDPATATALTVLRELPACPIKIPARWGRITDSFGVRDLGFGLRGSGFASKKDYSSHTNPETRIPKPVVVLIQDLHGNVGVQRNIAEILKHLASKQLPLQAPGSRLRKLFRAYSLEPRAPLTVFVEGAHGPFDVSILRNISDPWAKKQATEKFLRALWLTGVEVAAIESQAPLHLWGVDDKTLYLRNLDAFAKAFLKSPAPHFKNKAWQTYYEIAKERNIPLTLNSLRHWDLLSKTAASPSTMAVVTGGYHTEGIAQILRANHISYVVITPNVPALGQDHAYISRLRTLAKEGQKDTLVAVLVLALFCFIPKTKKQFIGEVAALQAAASVKRPNKNKARRKEGSLPFTLLVEGETHAEKSENLSRHWFGATSLQGIVQVEVDLNLDNILNGRIKVGDYVGSLSMIKAESTITFNLTPPPHTGSADDREALKAILRWLKERGGHEVYISVENIAMQLFLESSLNEWEVSLSPPYQIIKEDTPDGALSQTWIIELPKLVLNKPSKKLGFADQAMAVGRMPPNILELVDTLLRGDTSVQEVLEKNFGYMVYYVDQDKMNPFEYDKLLIGLAKELGFDREKVMSPVSVEMEEGKIVWVSGDEAIFQIAYELSYNIMDHAGSSGVVLVRKVTENDKEGIEIVIRDLGKGMDIEKSMQMGYTTPDRLGVRRGHRFGLPLTRDYTIYDDRGTYTAESQGQRLVFGAKNIFEPRVIDYGESAVKTGTLIIARRFPKSDPPRISRSKKEKRKNRPTDVRISLATFLPTAAILVMNFFSRWKNRLPPRNRASYLNQVSSRRAA